MNRAFIKVPLAGDYDVFALTFSSNLMLVVLADVVLPWHRDVVVLQQNRGRGHAISHVEEEVVGPGGIFVWWVDPGAEAWRGCEWEVSGHGEKKGLLTFADVQVHDQRAERIAQGGHGVDFGGDAGRVTVLWFSPVSRWTQIMSDRGGLIWTHHFRHLLNKPVNNGIAEPLILQPQSQQIRLRQARPLRVFVNHSLAIVLEILVQIGMVAKQHPLVEESVVDREDFGDSVDEG
jgi:hypothetical protein